MPAALKLVPHTTATPYGKRLPARSAPSTSLRKVNGEPGWSVLSSARRLSKSWGRSAPTDIAVLRHRLIDTTPGEVVELCPAAAPVMATIGARIAASKGAAFIVDYGGWQSRGDTFQALRGHAYTDPLAAPGQADLTAQVDFAALAAAAGPVRAAYTSQGAWLTALGIQARAAKLGEHLQGAARHSHLRALHRLTAPSEMGQVFKVLAIFAPRSAIPPGFS